MKPDKIIVSIKHFFSTNAVKDNLINETLTELQIFCYFYFIFMYDFLGLIEQSFSIAGRSINPLDIIHLWGFYLITGIGILILFIANGAKNGKNFVVKFYALTFTVGYKYGLALIMLDYLTKFINSSLV